MPETLDDRIAVPQWSDPGDFFPDQAEWSAFFDAINDAAAVDGQGLRADRPAAGAARTPGVRGGYYFATDGVGGSAKALSRSDGAAWHELALLGARADFTAGATFTDGAAQGTSAYGTVGVTRAAGSFLAFNRTGAANRPAFGLDGADAVVVGLADAAAAIPTPNHKLSAFGDTYARGADHFFGANAMGAAGSRIHLGSLGDASTAYVQSEGSGATTHLRLRGQGAAANITLQPDASTSTAVFTATAVALNQPTTVAGDLSITGTGRLTFAAGVRSKISLGVGDQYEINLGTDSFQFRKPDYAPSKFSWLKNATEIASLDNSGLLKVNSDVFAQQGTGNQVRTGIVGSGVAAGIEFGSAANFMGNISANLLGIYTASVQRATIDSAGILAKGALRAEATGGTVRLYLKATDAAADGKVWDVMGNYNVLHFRSINDAETLAHTWLTVNRSGYIVSTADLFVDTKIIKSSPVFTMQPTSDSGQDAVLSFPTAAGGNRSEMRSNASYLRMWNWSNLPLIFGANNVEAMKISPDSSIGTSQTAMQLRFRDGSGTYRYLTVNVYPDATIGGNAMRLYVNW